MAEKEDNIVLLQVTVEMSGFQVRMIPLGNCGLWFAIPKLIRESSGTDIGPRTEPRQFGLRCHPELGWESLDIRPKLTFGLVQMAEKEDNAV
jgi:hypothetical protein